MSTELNVQRPVFGWGWLLFTLSLTLLFGKLAWWQWQRSDQKTAIIQQLADWQQHPLALIELLNKPGLSEQKQLDGARVQGQGEWLAPTLFLVDNQVVNGRVGYDVVIPVRVLDTQSGAVQPNHRQDLVVLVNLGWVAATAQRSQLPVVTPPQHLEIDGIYRQLKKPWLLGQNEEDNGLFPMRIQAVDVQNLATLMATQLPNALIYQSSSPYQYHYQPVVMPPEKHRAYAWQWLMLAVMTAFLGGHVAWRYRHRTIANSAGEPHA